MQDRDVVTVALPNGQKVQIEALSRGGVQKVSGGKIPDLSALGGQIEGIVEVLKAPLERMKPTKATIEFGIDVAIESGQLTALIVKGSATGNLKVALEWSRSESSRG